jgi:DMSO/TMAO reductase YedYZ molybdopterin-dependent catalytic subunit
MKKTNIIILLTLFVIVLLPGCIHDKSRNETDINNVQTPSDKRLLPAEKGQVRSAFGVPVIDTNNFKLEITGLVDSSYFLTWNEIRDLPKVFSDTILMYCVEGCEVWGIWEGIMAFR